MKRMCLVIASMVTLLCGCAPTSAPTLNAVAQPYVYGTYVSETMIDRCSSDVIISLHYSSDDVFDPNQVDGLMLIRAPGGNAYTEWSDQMPVHGHTWIRWFCHSTTGNIFDVGTWRIHGATIGTKCTGDWDQGQVDECQPVGSIDLGSSAVGGWTPERSRCDSENTKAISARLGPDRLLEMRCLE